MAKAAHAVWSIAPVALTAKLETPPSSEYQIVAKLRTVILRSKEGAFLPNFFPSAGELIIITGATVSFLII